MPRCRNLKPPNRQAAEIVGKLVQLGSLRRNPNRPASVRTVANYHDCLLQIAKRITAQRLELRDLTPESATDYLRSRAQELGQKALDMHRQALQAMLVHVSGRLPANGRLEIIRSDKPRHLAGRTYTKEQIRRVGRAQSTHNALATQIAYAAGLRAHELFTLARPDEQRPDPRPARESKFDGRPGRYYTVVGKGGLVRAVRIPNALAERLEERRRAEPVRITDRGVHYLSRYEVGGGHAWSESFSSASKRTLGWSTGAHSVRHSYAQERMRELQSVLVREGSLETVSQELGHFRPEITETYLR